MKTHGKSSCYDGDWFKEWGNEVEKRWREGYFVTESNSPPTSNDRKSVSNQLHLSSVALADEWIAPKWHWPSRYRTILRSQDHHLITVPSSHHGTITHMTIISSQVHTEAFSSLDNTIQLMAGPYFLVFRQYSPAAIRYSQYRTIFSHTCITIPQSHILIRRPYHLIKRTIVTPP